MNIHEYQAKSLLRSFGVPVPEGLVAADAQAAEAAFDQLGAPLVAVKAQIHAGGRGAGHFAEDPGGKGGVRLARSAQETRGAAEAMLGRTLVTKQTGAAGRQVGTIYVEAGCDIARELYLCLLVDRGTGRITIVASAEGGMDIETLAEERPEAILRQQVDPVTGLQPFHARKLATGLGLTGGAARGFGTVLAGLYEAFIALDAGIIEINPLVVTGPGGMLALDAKIAFDDNALFRHPQVEALRDEAEEDPREREAAKYGLSYIALDGEIGCMVNGAGLAMATMDIIKLNGAEPANFLDVGGGASKEKVTAAFRILLSDPQVKGILINIFGGIMRCDVIAEGVIAAAREVALSVPLVVRLEGTFAERGQEIIDASGLPIINADNLADAAAKVVAAVAGSRPAQKGDA